MCTLLFRKFAVKPLVPDKMARHRGGENNSGKGDCESVVGREWGRFKRNLTIEPMIFFYQVRISGMTLASCTMCNQVPFSVWNLYGHGLCRQH